MKIRIGIVLIFLGMVLLCGALSLFLCNSTEANQAERFVRTVLPQLQQEIPSQPPKEKRNPALVPEELLKPEDATMTEVIVDGDAYIGYLSIPSLKLELPILADWDYDLLQKAPCRYIGTVRGGDLVLMAHNYDVHFGRLSELSVGDGMIFIDMDGIVTHYQVFGRDVLAPTAVEEVTAGEFDLILFTCTYGGQSRVTVYCDRVTGE